MTGPLETVIAGVLGEHWPHPVFGCECTPTDDETGEKDVLAMSWEAHVAAEIAKALGAETMTYWGVREDDGTVWSMPFRPQLGAVSREVTTARIASEWRDA